MCGLGLNHKFVQFQASVYEERPHIHSGILWVSDRVICQHRKHHQIFHGEGGRLRGSRPRNTEIHSVQSEERNQINLGESLQQL